MEIYTGHFSMVGCPHTHMHTRKDIFFFSIHAIFLLQAISIATLLARRLQKSQPMIIMGPQVIKLLLI